jgi:hypothetical protein
MHGLDPSTAGSHPLPSGRGLLPRMPRPQQSRPVLSATGPVVSSVLLIWRDNEDPRALRPESGPTLWLG